MVNAVCAPQHNGTAGEYAVDYLDAKLSVVPIKGDTTKTPAITTWTQLQRTRMTVVDVRRHWLADNVGVGIICGAVSGNLEVIDFDAAELFEPFCEEMERLRPGLIATLTAHKTPEQGFHLIYRCTTPVDGNQKLAMRLDPTAKSGRKATIETRGEGGYVLAPGSPACCHRAKREYTHHSGPPVTNPTTISDADRQLLFRVAATFEEVFDEPKAVTATKSEGQEWTGLSPGDDFNQRATIESIIEPEGWVLDHQFGDKGYWRRPGKDIGWSATFGLKSTAGNELFCCFTENAHPLQGANGRNPCTTYTKFALYATLKHGGDFSAAATRLRTEGYGDQAPSRVFDGDDRFRPAPLHSTPTKAIPSTPPLERICIGQLIEDHPTLNEPVIEGLLRRLEVMNLNAAPKVGKSWFAIYIMLCVVTGKPIFGRYPVKQGKVLLVDLELHKSLIASRIKTVAFQMGIVPCEYVDMIDVIALRGDWRSMKELLAAAIAIGGDEYVLTVFDSKYRMNPGADENAAGETTSFYNDVDRFAELTNTGVIIVCHQTKGNQADKRITDTGSGSGAQSRAADCHAAIREHEEQGVYVLDAVVRSFAPFLPLAIRWDFPLWSVDGEADPAQLQGLQQPRESKRQLDDVMKSDQIIEALRTAPRTPRELRGIVDVSKERLDKLLAKLEFDARVVGEPHVKNFNHTTLYSIAETDPEFDSEGVVDF